MNNSLLDLQKILFDQLEKLTKAQNNNLEKEILRADAVVKVSRTVIDNAKVVLEAQKLFAEEGALGKSASKMLNMVDEKER